MKNFYWLLGVAAPRWAWAVAESSPTQWNPALIGQWFGGLVAVVALILVCLWALQRLGRWNTPMGGQIRMLGGLALGGREKLLVVEVGEIQLVLGVSPGRVQTLTVLDGDKRLSAGPEQSFGKQLQKVLKSQEQGK